MNNRQPAIRQSKAKGQVFLKSYKHISRIIAAVDKKTDAIVEIGPGQGALTHLLLTKDLPLYAIEIDNAWAKYLQIKYSVKNPHLHIINQDFLKFNFSAFLEDQLGAYKHINVVSNLPYYITAPILFRLFSVHQNCPHVYTLVLMMQKEVGERIVAEPGSKRYNYLSILAQFFYKITTITNVARHHFKPVPKVDSIVLKFMRNNDLDPFIVQHQTAFFAFVKLLFT